MSRDRKLLTWTLTAVCCVAFFFTEYGWLFPGLRVNNPWFDISQYCLNPSAIKLYNFWTFGLIHLSPLHLIFNMLSLHQLTPEPAIGSLAFSNLVTNLLYIGAFLHILVSYLFKLGLGIEIFMYQCTAGLSGAIFGLLVIDTLRYPREQQSLFGIVNVPGKYYPLALIALIQVIFPGASFLGHLCGAAAGFICHRYFTFLVAPSYLKTVEKRFMPSFVKNHPMYAPAVDEDKYSTRQAALLPTINGLRHAMAPAPVPFSGRGHTLASSQPGNQIIAPAASNTTSPPSNINSAGSSNLPLKSIKSSSIIL